MCFFHGITVLVGILLGDTLLPCSAGSFALFKTLGQVIANICVEVESDHLSSYVECHELVFVVDELLY